MVEAAAGMRSFCCSPFPSSQIASDINSKSHFSKKLKDWIPAPWRTKFQSVTPVGSRAPLSQCPWELTTKQLWSEGNLCGNYSSGEQVHSQAWGSLRDVTRLSLEVTLLPSLTLTIQKPLFSPPHAPIPSLPPRRTAIHAECWPQKRKLPEAPWTLRGIFFLHEKVLGVCINGCNIKFYKEVGELDPEFLGQPSKK